MLLYCLTAQSIEKSIAFFGGSGDGDVVKDEQWSFGKGEKNEKNVSVFVTYFFFFLFPWSESKMYLYL